MTAPLMQHQVDGIEHADSRLSTIYHIGMGGGKTRLTLESLKARGLDLVLVCCPKAVIPAWKKQAGLWAEEYDVVLLQKGTAAQKAKEVEQAVARGGKTLIVINYESAWRLGVLEKVKWDALVYDEVHRLKSPSGKASRWAALLGKRNPQTPRYGLSGTLLAHSPLDAYGIYRAMESPNCGTFGNSYSLFRARWAITNPAIPQMVIGYRDQNGFAKLISETTFHRKSEDILDLPELMHHSVEVELAPAERRVYQQLEQDFVAAVEAGTVAPANAMVQLGRMLEICGGHVHFDGDSFATELASPPSKAAALREIIEDLDPNEPLVVFARYRAELDCIIRECAKAGRSVSELSGRRNQLEDWQSGKTSTLVANTQSGGIGIDLTRASYGIFYSLSHSLADWLQAIARLHRPGQERTTHFYSLVAVTNGGKTVDGAVHRALMERREVIDDILERAAGFLGR